MKTTSRVLSVLVVLYGLAACGGGGGDGNTGNNSGSGLSSPIADVTGKWQVTETGVSDCPGEETFTNGPYEVTITQSGNDLTVGTPVGTFSGVIDRDAVSWSGSYPDNGGTVTITSMALTVAADGDSFSGSSAWTWTDGRDTCSGTVQAANGARVPGTGPVPPKPAGLIATSRSSSAIDLTWSPGVVGAIVGAINARPAGGGYKIERSLSQSSGFAEVKFVTATTTNYTDAGLNSDTLYYYRVLAYNGNGDSGYSNIASAMTQSVAPGAPGQPSGLVATATTSSRIELVWTDNATNETGFQVERSTNATSGFIQIALLSADATSYTDAALAGATTYYYRVRASNAAGNSPYSNTANASTLPPASAPAAPTNLAASALSSSSIRLTWTDRSTNETGFTIERSTSATGGFTQVGAAAANVTTFTNAGLNASTTYYYRVRSTNASITPALNSAYSNTASATTTSAVPVLSGPATSTSGSITLTWTFQWPSLVSNQDGYQLEESTTSTTTGFTRIYNSAGQGVADTQSPKSFTVTRTTAGTYRYRIRAVVAGVATNWSNVVSVNVAATARTLRITNNLSGNGSTVLRLRIASSANDLGNLPSTERLEPDNYCDTVPGRDIAPGGSGTFDVSSFGSSYVFFVGIGLWDFDGLGCSNRFQKKNWTVDRQFNPLWLWVAITVSNHTSGEYAWTLRYDTGSRLVADDGRGSVVNFAATNSDPIKR